MICPSTWKLADASAQVARTSKFGGLNKDQAIKLVNRYGNPILGIPKYNPRTPQGRDDACYHQAASASANEMMLERNRQIRNSGQVPITDPEILSTNWIVDYFTSAFLFRTNDEEEQQGKLFSIQKSLDGIVPYSPDRINQRQFESSLISQKDRDKAVIDELLKSGLPLGAARSVSETTATDPVSRVIFGKLMDDILPAQALPSSGMKARVDLPDDPSNLVNPIDEARRLRDMAASQVDVAPEFYRQEAQRMSDEMKRASDYNYWKGNHPVVALRPDQNKQIDPFTLRTPWTGGNPPIVVLEVTPKKKPKPKLSFIAEAAPWLAPVLGLIPVAGPLLAVAVSVASASEMKRYASKWKVPVSAFEPQYEPQPFQVALPLPQAQIAVNQPWFLPSLVTQFHETLATGDLNQLSEFINSSILPMSSSGIMPEMTKINRTDLQKSIDRQFQNQGLTANLSGDKVSQDQRSIAADQTATAGIAIVALIALLAFSDA